MKHFQCYTADPPSLTMYFHPPHQSPSSTHSSRVGSSVEWGEFLENIDFLLKLGEWGPLLRKPACSGNKEFFKIFQFQLEHWVCSSSSGLMCELVVGTKTPLLLLLEFFVWLHKIFSSLYSWSWFLYLATFYDNVDSLMLVPNLKRWLKIWKLFFKISLPG